MTIQETILGYPGLGSLSSDILTKIMIDRGLNPADDYNSSFAVKVNLATADTLVAALTSTDYTENKLSERFKPKEMMLAAMRLYRQNGEPEKANDLSKSSFKLIGRAPKKW